MSSDYSSWNLLIFLLARYQQALFQFKFKTSILSFLLTHKEAAFKPTTRQDYLTPTLIMYGISPILNNNI